MKSAGFEDAESVSPTGFNSSPKTRGVLIRARKPGGGERQEPMQRRGSAPFAQLAGPPASVTLDSRFRYEPAALVCHCFGYTQADIAADLEENGRSLILERIAAEKKRGGCRCTEKNPAGR